MIREDQREIILIMCCEKDISIYPLRKKENRRNTFLEEITTLLQ